MCVCAFIGGIKPDLKTTVDDDDDDFDDNNNDDDDARKEDENAEGEDKDVETCTCPKTT